MIIQSNTRQVVRTTVSILLTVLVVVGVAWGATMTQKQASEQALKMTEESIRRAAVQCYALEGIYQVTIDYLIEHYGIRPDTGRFVVHYQFIADNLLPDILVLPIVR